MADDVTIDLDAAKRARLEAQGSKHITYGGETFELPAEIPAALLQEMFAIGARTTTIAEAINELSGYVERVLNGQFTRWQSHDPSLDDIQEFVAEVAKLYVGLRSGESQASSTSSKTTTKSSRRPSSKPTVST